MNTRLLVVDDEEPFRRLLKKELSRKGYVVDTAEDGVTALAMLKGNAYGAVLLDVLMPELDGISLMKKLRGDPAPPPIIVITGNATIETAVEAMRHGAYDYIAKPYKLDELQIVIERACEFGRLRRKSDALQQELVRKESPDRLVGVSQAIQGVLSMVSKIAPTDSTVLIQGESGTGKELVAGVIWQKSLRSQTPLVPLNCASLSENLMESELFGHEKGAFTSAHRMKFGIVEVADRGTLFLDEIAEMPLGLQAKLLRFLDSGEFRRVGSNRTLKVDVRVIAATNRDLDQRVREGSFREDLYYRLKVIRLNLPPLRDRPEDIPHLVRHFIGTIPPRVGKHVTDISADALRALLRYEWPGNVRELENEIERAVILAEGAMIEEADLSVIASTPRKRFSSSAPRLDELERSHIESVLTDCRGNQTEASRRLGIDRKTLYRKMKKFGMS